MKKGELEKVGGGERGKRELERVRKGGKREGGGPERVKEWEKGR